MLISISWRNVWRNKLRSGVIIAAIALGLTAGIFSTAFYEGMVDQRVEKVIKSELSHIQIHKPGFRNETNIAGYIPDAGQIADEIRALPDVAGVSNRIIVYSMVASAETGAGVKVAGIKPDEERKISNIPSKLIKGTYFDEKRRNPIVIGQKLAEKLNVHLGSKVVITLQDVNIDITAGAFRVVGIFNTMSHAFDESNVFVRYTDLKRLTGMPDHAGHEIAILAKKNDQVNELQQKVERLAPGLEVLTWLKLSPEMTYLNEAMDLYMYIFIVIILFALLFGIINTMLMAVLERIKEIGMLMAIGMNKTRIFFLIMYETVLLSLTGGILGVITGALVSMYFETHKIDLSLWAEGYLQLGYDPFVYTRLEWPLLINVTIMVVITGILASIYPAWKALSYNPANALRIE